MKKSYVIGTGWWCGSKDERYGAGNPAKEFDCLKLEFADLWWANLKRFTNPEKLLITDSNSPVKPPYWIDGGKIEKFSMITNWGYQVLGSGYGYSSIFRMDSTAVTRAMILQGLYTMLNDIDYYVWLEQDCFLWGEGIIEKAIEDMGEDTDFSANTWAGAGSGIETCFMIFKASRILDIYNKFIEIGDMGMRHPDAENKYWNLTKHFSWKPLPFPGSRSQKNLMDGSQPHIFFHKMTPEQFESVQRYA